MARSSSRMARRQAVANLRAQVEVGWSADIQRGAGMPTVEASLAMVDAMERAVWI